MSSSLLAGPWTLTRLKPNSVRLLLWLRERDREDGIGVASTTSVPSSVRDGPGYVGMQQMRGLITRGLVYEAKDKTGWPLQIFYLTPAGKLLAEQLGEV